MKPPVPVPNAMCRMFAYSGPGRDLAPFLVGRGSLEALACEHGSGWGVATWTAGRAVVRRGPVAADDPKSGWRAAVADASGRPLVLAHLRKASMGRVSLENTHPFAFGPLAFAHNGTLYGLDDARRALLLASVDEDLADAVAGTTDSELAGALVAQAFRALPQGATPTSRARALARVAGRLRNLFPGLPGHATRTTMLAGDGRALVATRWGHTLAAYEGDGYAILASEPVGPDGEGWRLLADGASAVLADGRVRLVDGATRAWTPDLAVSR